MHVELTAVKPSPDETVCAYISGYGRLSKKQASHLYSEGIRLMCSLPLIRLDAITVSYSLVPAASGRVPPAVFGAINKPIFSSLFPDESALLCVGLRRRRHVHWTVVNIVWKSG